MFQPISQVKHLTRSIVELIMGLVTQVNPCLLLRVDVPKLIQSFSYIEDLIRVEAPAWDMPPGWASEDLEVGYDYRELLKDEFQVETIEELAEKDPAGLAKLWNSNTVASEAPYNRTDYKEAVEEWAKHSVRAEAAIPVCVLTKEGRDAVKFRGQSRKGMSNDLFLSIPTAKYSQQWALLHAMARTC